MIADFLGVVSREPNTDVGRLIADIGVDLSARGYATIGQVGGNACFWARPPHADLIHSCVAQMDRVVTCIDGTIYNREELLRGLPRRAEGSDRLSDADLVGRLLEAHGTHALPNIVGDFSLSYWDQGRQLLLLARDIIGIRSLFWHVGTSLVYWSTCIDDLAALLRRTVINKRWISYYIQSGILGESPGSETIYIGIYRVPPGSFVEIAAGRARVTQYWRPDRLPSIHYATWLEYVDHFRHLLSVAVGERLACRSHILATLSGGLDSSAVVSLAHYLLSKAGRQGSLTTYSLVFDQTPEANERRFSRAVRDYLGVENVELIADNAWEPPSDVSAMAGLLGEPTDRVVWGQLKFETQVAAKGDADVVLRGEGGDHLFDGSLILLAEMLRQGRLRDFCWSCVAAARWERTSVWRPAYEYGIGPLLFPFLFALNPVWSQTTGLHMPQAPEWLSLRHGELVIDRTALLDFFPAFRLSNPVRRHVVNVLATQNTWSTISRYDRQFGVEARWPFLDKRLVEYALAVPQAVLLDLGYHGMATTKPIIRHALHGWLPDLILERRGKGDFSRLRMLFIRNVCLPLVTSECLLDDYGLAYGDRFIPAVRRWSNGLWRREYPQAKNALAAEMWLRDYHAVTNRSNLSQGSPSMSNTPLAATTRQVRSIGRLYS